MTAIGLGKIILLGEHAVVYGFPALAAALDRGVAIAAVPTPAGGSLRIDIPAWNLKVTATDDHPVARSLLAIVDSLGLGRPTVSLVGDAQIPPGAGLGSSAALAVASATRSTIAEVVRGAPLGPTSTRRVGLANERSPVVLRNTPMPPAIARATSTPLGLPCISASLAEAAAVISRASSLRLACVSSARDTATASSADDPRLRALGGLTDTGTTALLAKDLVGLGAAMNRAHDLLSELGVSTEQLDSLCEAARVSGAYGAKLTGAGGGGAVIAIAPREREQAVLTEWKNVGVTGFVATVGGGAGTAA